MKPTALTPSPPGVPNPSPLPHKLELQTLKLEELTVSLGSSEVQTSNPTAFAALEIRIPQFVLSLVPNVQPQQTPTCAPEPA